MRALLLIAVAVGLAACYETPRPDCAFLCGDLGCPAGYTCASDGWCKRDDIADDFVCQEEDPDARTEDAGVPDAAISDATVFDGPR